MIKYDPFENIVNLIEDIISFVINKVNMCLNLLWSD